MGKDNLFTRHLNQAGEKYFEHFLFAFSIALWLIFTAFSLMIHAILPFLFVFTGSNNINKINQLLQKRRNQLEERKKQNS